MKKKLIRAALPIALLIIVAAGCGEVAPKQWSNARAVATGLDHPLALVSDGESLYFVTGGTIAAKNQGTNNVMKMPLAGGSPETLFKGGELVPDTFAAAIDETHLYFSANGIRRVPLKGGAAEVVTATGMPSEIVVDKSAVFWLPFVGEGMAPAPIYRVAKNGGEPVRLTDPRTGANGLNVDDANVYWIERSGIFRISKEGGTPATVYAAPADRPIDSLRLDREDFYFLEGDTQKRLLRIPRGGGQPVEIAKNVARFWIAEDSIVIERFVTSFDIALLKIPKAGGAETELDRNGHLADLAAAGKRIFFSDVSNIYVIGY